MQIRCKSSKRFLLNIDIEEFHKEINKIGISADIPITIQIPCAKCRMVEEYKIYKNNYEHIKSFKHNTLT